MQMSVSVRGEDVPVKKSVLLEGGEPFGNGFGGTGVAGLDLFLVDLADHGGKVFHVDVLSGELADGLQEVVFGERIVVGGDDVGDLPGGGSASDLVAEIVIGHEAGAECGCEFNGHGKILSKGC